MKQNWTVGFWMVDLLCLRNQCWKAAQWEWPGWIRELEYGFLRPFLMEAEHVFNIADLGLFREVWCKKLYVGFSLLLGRASTRFFMLPLHLPPWERLFCFPKEYLYIFSKVCSKFSVLGTTEKCAIAQSDFQKWALAAVSRYTSSFWPNIACLWEEILACHLWDIFVWGNTQRCPLREPSTRKSELTEPKLIYYSWLCYKTIKSGYY